MTKQALLSGAAVGLLSIALAACSNDARPDSYWLKHPKAAKQRIAQCKSDDTNIKQAIATKPPSALSALQRECLYLVYSGDYRRDKRGSDKMTTVSSVIDAKQAAKSSDGNQ